MGQWDDKFIRAERKWQSWRMQEYALADRVIHRILEDKARRHQNRTALRFRHCDLTWGGLNAMVNRAANGLTALGIRPGEKVAMMLPNCPEFLYFWFGLNRIGAVNVPINISQRGEGLAWQITDADCVALIADAAYIPHVEAISDRLPALRSLIVSGAGGDLVTGWPGVEVLGTDELLAAPDTTPDIAASYRDLSTILYTSGTTGRSKGVMIGHNYWYEVWAGCVQGCRYTEDDILYTGLPLFHSSATGTTVGPAILADAQAVVVERFSASRMMDDCRHFGATEAKYIGGIIPIMLKQAERPDDGDNPLRLMVGAAAPVELWDSFERRFNTRLLEMYGMTECTAALINPFDARRPGSCGKPLPNWEVRILDDDDCEVPPGTVGEIVTRPRNPWLGTSGYYGKPEATADLFRNFWIHTGDMGRMDEDGYFYFVDRKKQALRRRGENISSFEVESVINAMPQVLESCVVGVPAEMGEDEVKAVIVLKEGESLTAEAVIDWCVPRMAYFCIPRYIAFRDSLPKTSSHRIEKYRLKDEGVTPDCWDREAAGIVLAR
ncbi:AMP-binding protein [Paracoccus sp. J55]|uniref:AMP-binding protein n=1 Tax=Paracoccus sp. J55 TaxID=935849 RepID=UPI000490D24F|nr:AMP-binding protein [Paracoccus sp. J55]